MRPDWSHLEKYRDPTTSFRGDRYGWFIITRGNGTRIRCMASAGDKTVPWEHVSVSLVGRCPTWAEMSLVKDLFWGPDETVMQLHVPEEDHVNVHPYCLHLWRPTEAEIPRPPKFAVGPG